VTRSSQKEERRTAGQKGAPANSLKLSSQLTRYRISAFLRQPGDAREVLTLCEDKHAAARLLSKVSTERGHISGIGQCAFDIEQQDGGILAESVSTINS
jgi:hypothetical protein